MQRGRENVGRQVAEDHQELNQDEPHPLRELTAIQPTDALAKVIVANSSRLYFDRGEQWELCGSVVQHTIEDRCESTSPSATRVRRCSAPRATLSRRLPPADRWSRRIPSR